ncbi:MAG: hypothetical protein FWC45_09570 [Treponema sp.]|nr:hypothetical protein [Treponema sp.]
MKIRTDYVTNSSSSSFTIRKKQLSEKQIKAIWNHSALGKKLGLEYPEDRWEITENEEFIIGETTMDNFDMAELLDIIGVRNTQITWGHYEPEFPKDDEDMIADSKYLDRKKRWETLVEK